MHTSSVTHKTHSALGLSFLICEMEHPSLGLSQGSNETVRIISEMMAGAASVSQVTGSTVVHDPPSSWAS